MFGLIPLLLFVAETPAGGFCPPVTHTWWDRDRPPEAMPRPEPRAGAQTLEVPAALCAEHGEDGALPEADGRGTDRP